MVENRIKILKNQQQDFFFFENSSVFHLVYPGRPSIKTMSHCLKSFLPRCIPNLQPDPFIFNLHIFHLEINTYRIYPFRIKIIITVPSQNRCLTNSGVA